MVYTLKMSIQGDVKNKISLEENLYFQFERDHRLKIDRIVAKTVRGEFVGLVSSTEELALHKFMKLSDESLLVGQIEGIEQDKENDKAFITISIPWEKQDWMKNENDCLIDFVIKQIGSIEDTRASCKAFTEITIGTDYDEDDYLIFFGDGSLLGWCSRRDARLLNSITATGKFIYTIDSVSPETECGYFKAKLLIREEP